MKVSFVTLGCKVNQYETEAMAEALEANGFLIVPFGEVADATIINTCAVTTEGERKARQMIRRARSVSPEAFLAVTGCAAQLHPESLKRIEGVSYIGGNGQKMAVVEAILAHFREKSLVDVRIDEPTFELSHFEPMRIVKSERTRAYIKIEDGCDAHCAYCIIRKARGQVRSKALDEVVKEAEALVAAGYRELVLTGIEISAYGKDRGESLTALLQALDSLSGLERIRLGSLDPAFLRPTEIARLAKLQKLCHHFHLSLQSGCDKTLAAMRRRNNTQMAREAVETIRAAMTDAIFTADVIVGFPGETDDDFEETRAFVASLGLLDCHIFAFSPRPGTEAATMPDSVCNAVKRAREKALSAVVEESRAALLDALIGQRVSVLFEEYRNGLAVGHTANFIEVEVPSPCDLHNRLLPVTLLRRENSRLIGKLAE